MIGMFCKAGQNRAVSLNDTARFYFSTKRYTKKIRSRLRLKMVLDYYYLVHKIARNLNHHSSTSRRQMRLTGLEPVRKLLKNRFVERLKIVHGIFCGIC